jgi:hypothetical protein
MRPQLLIAAIMLSTALSASHARAADISDIKPGLSGISFKVHLRSHEIDDLAAVGTVPLPIPKALLKFADPIRKALARQARKFQDIDEGNGVTVTFKAGVHIGGAEPRK